MDGITVTKYGTSPVVRYGISGPDGWRSSIFLDEDAGQIVIEFDSRIFFGHWWGKTGTKSFKEFLVQCGDDYLGDKFSYGMSRFNGVKLEARLREDVERAFADGEIDEIEKDTIIDEAIDQLDGTQSPDHYFHIMWQHDDLVHKIWGGDLPSGEGYMNKDVQAFLEKFWPAFKEQLKKELAL